MIDSNTPLFVQKHPLDWYTFANGVPIEREWFDYVNMNKPDSVSGVLNVSYNMELFKYNIDNLSVPINTEQFELWTTLAKAVHAKYGSESFLGQTYQKLIESSEKSEEVLIHTAGLLTSASFYTALNLFCLTSSDIFYELSRSNHGKLICTLTERMQQSGPLDENVILLVKNIYKPEIMNLSNKYLLEYAQSAIHVGKHLETFIILLKESNPEYLTNIICMTHALDFLSTSFSDLGSTGLFDQRGPQLVEDFHGLFKSEYPDIYRKYQTLSTLDLNQRELCLQLTNKIRIDDAPVIEF